MTIYTDTLLRSQKLITPENKSRVCVLPVYPYYACTSPWVRTYMSEPAKRACKILINPRSLSLYDHVSRSHRAAAVTVNWLSISLRTFCWFSYTYSSICVYVRHYYSNTCCLPACPPNCFVNVDHRSGSYICLWNEKLCICVAVENEKLKPRSSIYYAYITSKQNMTWSVNESYIHPYTFYYRQLELQKI